MNRHNFNSALLYFLCLVVIYQQYAIYRLQNQNSLEPNRYNSNIQYKIKSPAPVVPVYQLRTNEDRSVGGKGEKSIYGGAGDEIHLGGFTQRDNDTISENLWNYMLGTLAVKSFLDIGCGRGFSSKFFMDRGARVLCIEGSHDALNHTLLPHNVIVQHDYSKGKWWPADTYDVAYSTEFVEHVGRQYIPNYMATMKKAALVMFTSSTWGGYHHVEVHDRAWWIARFQAHGFIYSAELSKALSDEVLWRKDVPGSNGELLIGMMAFLNPSVASLPQHQHLFGGNGCYNYVEENRDGGAACTGVDALPAQYESLLSCDKYHSPFQQKKHINETWNCRPNPRAIKQHQTVSYTTK